MLTRNDLGPAPLSQLQGNNVDVLTAPEDFQANNLSLAKDMKACALLITKQGLLVWASWLNRSVEFDGSLSR